MNLMGNIERSRTMKCWCIIFDTCTRLTKKMQRYQYQGYLWWPLIFVSRSHGFVFADDVNSESTGSIFKQISPWPFIVKWNLHVIQLVLVCWSRWPPYIVIIFWSSVSPETWNRKPLSLVQNISNSRLIKFIQVMVLDWLLTFVYKGQND